MKKITKRIMAFVLSLVMMLGCIPSFINEASAEDLDGTVEFSCEAGKTGQEVVNSITNNFGGIVDSYSISKVVDNKLDSGLMSDTLTAGMEYYFYIKFINVENKENIKSISVNGTALVHETNQLTFMFPSSLPSMYYIGDYVELRFLFTSVNGPLTTELSITEPTTRDEWFGFDSSKITVESGPGTVGNVLYEYMDSVMLSNTYDNYYVVYFYLELGDKLTDLTKISINDGDIILDSENLVADFEAVKTALPSKNYLWLKDDLTSSAVIYLKYQFIEDIVISYTEPSSLNDSLSLQQPSAFTASGVNTGIVSLFECTGYNDFGCSYEGMEAGDPAYYGYYIVTLKCAKDFADKAGNANVIVNGNDITANKITGKVTDFLKTNQYGWRGENTLRYNDNFYIYALYDFSTPKTPITSVSLNGKGSLIGGVAISKQTLKYTEADGNKYKSNDEKGEPWYTTPACDIQADAIVAGTTYYKKIPLVPVDGYKFDTISNVPVTNGTFVSVKPNGKNLDVVIKATAEEFLQRDITVDVYKNNVKSNDPFITGSTNSNISFKDGVKTVDADWYENKVKNTGTITFDKTKLQTAIITINEEYKEPTSVKVGGTTLTKVTGESDFYTDELASVYYYDSTNYKVVIKYLTMPKKSTLIINPTKDLYVGQDVQEVKITFDGLHPTACNYYKMLDDETPDPFSSEIEKDETYKLAGNISYGYDIAANFTRVYDGVKFGNVELEYSATPNKKTSLKDYNTSESTLSIIYAFDGKDKPQPSHKKKKTEEPKQDEPKTLEEKLQDELKKDDVKKANSNEGEKINPSAKYINGYDDGSFKPNNKVNNIELMSMVTELFDNVEIKETKDLNQGKDYWGQEIIDKANALGLVPGNKDNKNYNVTDEVTRGDLAIVVYNLIKDYSDAQNLKDRNNCKDAIGTSYEKEAAKLLELGIFKGYDDGMFHGDYTLTRAEAVVVINRALKSLGFEINMPNIKLSFPDLSEEHWAYAEIMYAANK
ncbi:MAG: S-layer homology domain-containing protein [Clostridia bacterium]|nr:S-layer homology domain-containing protein [Clostridia bacterium]